jgi:hypothetical protein
MSSHKLAYIVTNPFFYLSLNTSLLCRVNASFLPLQQCNTRLPLLFKHSELDVNVNSPNNKIAIAICGLEAFLLLVKPGKYI